MELNELEQNLDVEYPQKWKDIYKSGVMEWLKHDHEWLIKNRDEVNSNPSAFFYSLEGDCEPIQFLYVNEKIKILKEVLFKVLQHGNSQKYLNPHYKIIPFAQMGSGDLFCFLFDDQEEQPLVAVFRYDTGTVDSWAKDFDEFLYLQLVSAVMDWDEDMDSVAWQAHFNFLADEYKKKIVEQTMVNLEKEIMAMSPPKKVSIFLDTM